MAAIRTRPPLTTGQTGSLATTSTSGTGAVSFVSWVRHHGRSQRLAELLGAEPHFVAVGRSGNRWTVPARYARQAVRTARLLRDGRPRAVVTMAPPLLLPVLCRLLHRGPLVLDAHSGAVLRGDRVRLTFRLIARLADVVVVASESLAILLRERHGIRALPVHDPLTPRSGDASAPSPAPTRHQNRSEVVFPAGWRADEPIDAVLGAARLLPEVTFAITGRAPAGLDVPPNVWLTGYLDADEYDALVAGASVVLALTTRPLTMQRAGYEAIEHGRPLVASDTEVLREHFTAGAVFAGATAESLAAAITDARARAGELTEGMRALGEHRARADRHAVASVREAMASC